MKPIIISGGPGAGKTTLINALAERGYQTYAEVSRTLIEQQAALPDGILPWVDLPKFAQLCLDVMCQQKQQASEHDVAFVDRAIPDICGYLVQAELAIEPQYIEGSQGYHPVVFMCRPNSEIYVQDEVRPYPFEGALEIHESLVAVYQQLGFEIKEVPWGSVEQRAAFIEQSLALR